MTYCVVFVFSFCSHAPVFFYVDIKNVPVETDVTDVIKRLGNLLEEPVSNSAR